MRLEINKRRKTTTITNMWKLTRSLKTNRSKMTSQEKPENALRMKMNENENNIPKLTGCSESNAQRENYSYKFLHKEERFPVT